MAAESDPTAPAGGAGAGPVLLRTADVFVERRVARAAAALGLETILLAGGEDLRAVHPSPSGLLISLELDDAIGLLERSRAASSTLVIVGYLTDPRPDLWQEAERAGADVVTTRGLADRELTRRLTDVLSGARRARRIRLAPYREFAGRLGFVGRVDETPAGPVGVYQLGSRLYAVADECPHAGASLCEGDLENDVVTCPRHGSQFRVTDGSRLRGPADHGIRSFRVLIDGGEVFLDLDAV